MLILFEAILLNVEDFVNKPGAELMNELKWQTHDQIRDYYLATLIYKHVHMMKLNSF